MTDTIGFIGLGNMGTPMVTRLVAAGIAVRAYDISAEARARAVAAGAVEAADLAAAVEGVDAVILMLPDSNIVEAVVEDLPLTPGTLLVDMSSSEPLRTKALAEKLAAKGVPMIDAPVSGGVSGAVAGTLTVMTGGSETDVERIRPALENLGRVVHAGAIGSGHAIKSLNNLVSATHLLVTSEAILAGEKFGLDPVVMLDIINGSTGRSWSSQTKWPNYILPETYNSGFGLRLMLKDMKIAVQLAEQSGSPATVGADAVQSWQKAADSLEPTADHTEIARWLRSQQN